MPENEEDVRRFATAANPEEFLAPYFRYFKSRGTTEMLHHYTTAAGLLGILHDGSAWATNFEYFNDIGELSYIHDVMDESLDAYLVEFQSTDRESSDALAAFFTAKRRRIFSDDVYVMSFSENGDLLSQWERYANGHGFSLGFKTSTLVDTLAPVTAKVMPVLYNKSKQLTMVREMLIFAFAMIDSATPPPTLVEKLTWANDISNMMRTVCHAFKHDAFEEEAEWRIVRSIPHGLNSDVQFRTGKFGIIPYVEHNLLLNNVLNISQICVAPTHYFEETKRAVELYLVQMGVSMNSDNILKSHVPLRI